MGTESRTPGYNAGPRHAIDTMLAEAPKRFRRRDSGVGLPGMTLRYPAG